MTPGFQGTPGYQGTPAFVSDKLGSSKCSKDENLKSLSSTNNTTTELVKDKLADWLLILVLWVSFFITVIF